MQRSQAARSALTGIRLFRGLVLAACLALTSAQAAFSASPIQQLTSDGATDVRPAWSPSGTLLAVDSGSESVREIWTIDLSSGARSQVTSLGSIATFPG